MTSKWYFTRDNRQKYGPYTTEQLRQFAVEGLITPTDRLLQEGAPPAPDGGRKWKLASEIEELLIPLFRKRPVKPVLRGASRLDCFSHRGSTHAGACPRSRSGAPVVGASRRLEAKRPHGPRPRRCPTNTSSDEVRSTGCVPMVRPPGVGDGTSWSSSPAPGYSVGGLPLASSMKAFGPRARV